MKQIIPVKQGDNITLTVNGLGSSGEGVGKYEGFTVFVKGALPEEEVRVTITLVKKSYAVWCAGGDCQSICRACGACVSGV